MKKLFTISLVLFWTITVAVLAAGLVLSEKGDDVVPREVVLEGETVVQGKAGNKPVVEQSFMSANIVATHNEVGDCWLIISGKVYDVTAYIPFHPSGEMDIINNCGTDATVLFTSDNGEGHRHSVSAEALLERYYVADLGAAWGTVNTSSQTQVVADTVVPAVSPAPQKAVVTEAPIVVSTALTTAVVAGHSSVNDCWMIVSGKVYDVTSYIPFHPGGASDIVDNCGTDATTLFTSSSGGGHRHSGSAHNILAKYYVGDLGSAVTAETASETSVTTEYAPPKSPEQAYIDAINKQYPGAQITKLSLEDDGRAEFKFVLNGEEYEGKMNAQYQIIDIE